MESLLKNKGILCSIMEYIGSIKFCIFTFLLLFKELDGVHGCTNIINKIKDIFIHHIYKNLYIDFFKPIQNSIDSIDRLHKIICPTKGAKAAKAVKAATAANCEELSLIYAKRTVLYLTTPHSDNTWFMQAIGEYYYIGAISIKGAIVFGLSENNENLNLYPIYNILLYQLDKKIYRFHIDGMTKSYLHEDTTLLDDYYSEELYKKLNIVNGNPPVFDYITDDYESDNKVMFWALLNLLFTDYKDIIGKGVILKKCTCVLYNRYLNNTMLLTYNIKLFNICANYIFIERHFNGILSFLKYFNDRYPDMKVDVYEDLIEMRYVINSSNLQSEA
jgi:hypothetical protein